MGSRVERSQRGSSYLPPIDVLHLSLNINIGHSICLSTLTRTHHYGKLVDVKLNGTWKEELLKVDLVCYKSTYICHKWLLFATARNNKRRRLIS